MTRRLAVITIAIALAAAAAGCSGGTPATNTTAAGAGTTSASATTGTSQVPADEGISMARVGAVAITEAQFAAQLAKVESLNPAQVPDKQTKPDVYKDFQRAVLENMVRNEIVRQKATVLNISVSETDVQTQVEKVKKTSFGGSQADLEAALAKAKVTLAQFESGVKEQLLMQKTVDEVTKGVADPSNTEIEAYYNSHLSDYYQNETREVRHILIAPKGATDADWAAAKAEADALRAEILAGADFSQKAKNYSDDSQSRDYGGSLGKVQKGQTVAAFEEAVFSLEPGQLSQPVRTQTGYHILIVDAINPPVQLSLDAVTSSVRATLLNGAKLKVWEAWVARTKSELGVTYQEGMQMTTATTTVTQDPTTPASQ